MPERALRIRRSKVSGPQSAAEQGRLVLDKGQFPPLPRLNCHIALALHLGKSVCRMDASRGGLCFTLLCRSHVSIALFSLSLCFDGGSLVLDEHQRLVDTCLARDVWLLQSWPACIENLMTAS
jgi:hypothetical protein